MSSSRPRPLLAKIRASPSRASPANRHALPSRPFASANQRTRPPHARGSLRCRAQKAQHRARRWRADSQCLTPSAFGCRQAWQPPRSRVNRGRQRPRGRGALPAARNSVHQKPRPNGPTTGIKSRSQRRQRRQRRQPEAPNRPARSEQPHGRQHGDAQNVRTIKTKNHVPSTISLSVRVSSLF